MTAIDPGMTGQSNIDQLRLRQKLALSMLGNSPRTNSPIAAGLNGLAQILAARSTGKIGGQIAEAEKQKALFEQEGRAKDMTALGHIFSTDRDKMNPSQLGLIQDPQIQQLAATFLGQQLKPQSSRFTSAGIPGVMVDQSDPTNTFDVTTGQPIQYQPQTQQAPDQATGQPQAPAMSDRIETPAQKRKRDLAASIERDEAKAALAREKEIRTKRPKAVRSMEKLQRENQVMLEDIDRAISLARSGSAGVGSLFANLPATDARTLRELLVTIEGNVAFGGLQEMREASPTGGALGNVSDNEGKRLGALQGSFDQGLQADALISNLERAKELRIGAFQSAAEAFETDFGEAFGGGSNPVLNHPQHGDITEDDIQETMRQNNMTREQVLEALNVR